MLTPNSQAFTKLITAYKADLEAMAGGRYQAPLPHPAMIVLSKGDSMGESAFRRDRRAA